jgi:hypothetical protein
MGRIILLSIMAVFVGAAILSSASSGMVSRIPDLPRTGKLALVGLLCLAGWAGWFYLQGGFDYLLWLTEVPARPAAELQFVSSVQDAADRWSDEQSGGAAACRRATAAIEAAAEPITDWVGTVYLAYRVGSKMGLVVRIGRSTVLRTSYLEGTDAVLLEPGSNVFDQSVTLKSGDPVRFSGTIVTGAGDCAFQPDVLGHDTGSEFVFRFTQLQRG